MKALRIFFLGLLICLVAACNKKDPPLMRTQELRLCLRKDPVSMDPRIGNDMASSQIHFMMYEGLYQLNPDMTLSPAQAKSCDISPDKTTYTFHLNDTKWSDGQSVTAVDFERSWKKILDPKFPSPDAYLLFCVKNGKAAKKGECPLEEVSIRALDDKTLQVDLAYPTPYFLQIVASSVLLPVPSSGQSFNGPFKLAKWDFNQHILLEKNPLYRKANKVKLARVSMEILDREMAALHMYASGHYDLIGAPLSFFPAMLNQDLEQKKVAAIFPVANTKFLSFNTEKFPFNNAAIRRAFSYAIHRQSITKNITQFHEQEALNFIPPALLSSQPSLPLEANAQKAKEWMEKGREELGKKIGPITFMYCASEVNHLIAQELQSQWSKILDVKVNLECVDFKTLHERSEKGDFSIGLFALLADYGDPMNVLERFQDKTNHRNYSKWENETYNQLLEKAHQATSEKEYIEQVKKAEAFLLEEMPIAGLFHENYLFLIHPHIKGFAVSPLGHIYFDRISISEE